MPPPDRQPPVPSSQILSFLDEAEIERVLAPWLPDPHDRAFVARCMLREGPAHHRGANYVLLRLLAEAAATRAAVAPAAPDDTVAVPLRLPPRVAGTHADDHYPLTFPRRVLERLAPDAPETVAAMIDCVTDGPPQHALANAAMLCLLDALLGGRPAP